MGIKVFKIMFYKHVKTYFPGETVLGQILLDLDSHKKCRGIKIEVTGEAVTRWTITTIHGRMQMGGRDKYFSSTFYIAGGESDELNLDAGQHIFPFDYALPQNLPTSFEFKQSSTQAYIRYTVKAIIDNPWKINDKTQAAFSVISEYDLNTEPIAAEPVLQRKIKTFGVFSSSPPLSAVLSLPVNGYVPGQLIPIKVNVNNQSGIEINDIKLKLTMSAEYKGSPCRSMTKFVKTTIIKDHKGKIDADNVNLEHEFIVPSLPPSNIDFSCKIISIKYAIEFEAEVNKKLSRNLKISAPILIGTVPLLSFQPFVTPSADLAISPIYKKSMFVVKSIKEENDSEHVMETPKYFAPRYPFFNFVFS